MPVKAGVEIKPVGRMVVLFSVRFAILESQTDKIRS